LAWDDLRFFIELVRAGKLVVAARRLGVEHTTVSRRIHALETKMGVPLFVRSSTGYELTQAGQSLLPVAQSMERAYSDLQRSLPKASVGIEGVVRIGCNEAYGTTILPKHVADLVASYPRLSVEILALPRAIQLPRQEADIVITIDRPKRGPYTVVRLAEYKLGIYASRSYLDTHPSIASPDDLSTHSFVNYIEELALAKSVPSPSAIGNTENARVRSTSILAQRSAAEAGAGLVILPRYIVAPDGVLHPVLPSEVEFSRTYWMTTPVDMKGVAKVRCVWTHLRSAAQAETTRLNGHSFGPGSEHI
jgi:DNA-binding transcriptional LysR family regulator